MLLRSLFFPPGGCSLRFDVWRGILGLLVTLLLFAACSGSRKQEEAGSAAAPPPVPELSFFVLPDGQGYGYEITLGSRVFIHQEVVPALEGNRRFRTREEARLVGAAVLERVKNNLSPGLTREEVENLLRPDPSSVPPD